MNYRAAKHIGREMIVVGITVLLCALFFIFFGTKLIDENYLASDSIIDAAGDAENLTDNDTAADDSADGTNGESVAASDGSTQDGGSQSYEFQEEQTSSASQSQPSTISIPGIKSLTVAENSTTASVDLYNPNKNECYFRISILLKDSGEQIYQSDLVLPGQHIYEIQLSAALSAGEYEAILHYDAYTMDGSYTELNGADVSFTLIVE